MFNQLLSQNNFTAFQTVKAETYFLLCNTGSLEITNNKPVGAAINIISGDYVITALQHVYNSHTCTEPTWESHSCVERLPVLEMKKILNK